MRDKKTWSRVLAALVLALSVILSTWPDGATTQARPLTSAKSNTASSSSESLKDLQANSKNPFKQAGSSFQRIPPSTSNPTQNKCNPPYDG